MLHIYENISSIDFRQLMDVYAEGNQINGDERYSGYPENLRILYSEQDFYNYLVLFFEDSASKYAVWTHENRYVAALRLERYSDGLLLTALETEPAHRRQGFATALIGAVLCYLKSNGTGKLYSHVAKLNQASLTAHKNCGFDVVSNQATYLDGTIMNNSYTLLIEY